MRRRIDLLIVTNNIKTKSMETNFKEGKYFTISGMWDECIPFEGNEHLLGTREEIN